MSVHLFFLFDKEIIGLFVNIFIYLGVIYLSTKASVLQQVLTHPTLNPQPAESVIWSLMIPQAQELMVLGISTESLACHCGGGGGWGGGIWPFEHVGVWINGHWVLTLRNDTWETIRTGKGLKFTVRQMKYQPFD